MTFTDICPVLLQFALFLLYSSIRWIEILTLALRALHWMLCVVVSVYLSGRRLRGSGRALGGRQSSAWDRRRDDVLPRMRGLVSVRRHWFRQHRQLMLVSRQLYHLQACRGRAVHATDTPQTRLPTATLSLLIFRVTSSASCRHRHDVMQLAPDDVN